MNVKGLSFSPEMVTALLDGRKTQTRRVPKRQRRRKPDNLIYVREALERGRDTRTRATCFYLATDTGLRADVPLSSNVPRDNSGGALWLWKGNKLNPSRMPRWASRLTLEVTDFKIERLQDISEEDAIAEGVNDVKAYRALWEMLHGKRSWNTNPWVIAISFTVIEQNVDEVLAERKAA